MYSILLMRHKKNQNKGYIKNIYISLVEKKSPDQVRYREFHYNIWLYVDISLTPILVIYIT